MQLGQDILAVRLDGGSGHNPPACRSCALLAAARMNAEQYP